MIWKNIFRRKRRKSFPAARRGSMPAQSATRCCMESGIRNFYPNTKNSEKPPPLRRNDRIVEYADLVLAFWDGASRGTRYVIERCKTRGKSVKILLKNSV